MKPETLQDPVAQELQQAALAMLDQLKEGKAAKLIADENIRLRQQTEGVDEVWGRAIDKLEVVLIVARELVGDIRSTYQDEATLEKDAVLLALMQLYQRACDTTSEIILLLRHGYTHGAEARWRTVYEYAVIASFIQKTGQESAKRFLIHQMVDYQDILERYHEIRLASSEDSSSSNEIDEIKKYRTYLNTVFGNGFKRQYGWTRHILTDDIFLNIEKYVELDYLRAAYKSSSHKIHASAKDVISREKDSDQTPSIAIQTCLSLEILTGILSKHRYTSKFLVLLIVMFELGTEVIDSFSNTWEEID